MNCIKCGCEDSKVIDSRSIEEGNSIRRRMGEKKWKETY